MNNVLMINTERRKFWRKIKLHYKYL